MMRESPIPPPPPYYFSILLGGKEGVQGVSLLYYKNKIHFVIYSIFLTLDEIELGVSDLGM